MLAVVTRQQTSKGKILVEIRPMNAKRRNLNIAQLLRCSERQTRIRADGKTNLSSASQ